MENIKYPKNYENWPATWKSCFEDGVNAGLASAHNSDYAKSCETCVYGVDGCQHEPPCSCVEDKEQELLKDIRKFFNRLPAEWFPENLVARLDIASKEE